ncbi:MAG: Holliday junction branch migration protein RuvA [Puniceicoccales bacterium]|jgi:Holliday junction DNA helicase RuvA|nr:Holliday junction branch migration protein RuvA [Puniceicoccales bacterium]
MIAFVEGVLIEVGESFLVLDVHGIGYELIVNHASNVLRLGETYKLYTAAIYKEDSQQLYGFWEPSQRNFFRLLVGKVNGIGPKLAMSILAYFPMDDLCQMILSENFTLLSQCPGVGKKTAQRLILDLKDFLKKQLALGKSNVTTTLLPHIHNDVIAALMALGYARKQAEKLFEDASQQLNTEDSVESILKKIFSQRGNI